MLAIAFAVAGCADDRDERPAQWSYISATIIAPNCATAGCHSQLAATYGLQLDSRIGAYFELVGPHDAAGNPQGQNYVVPGDPDASKLMWLLTGTEVTTRMPPDNPLPDADIDLVRRWIAAGAKFN